MSDKPANPFSGLDKALLRSTRPQSPPPTDKPAGPASSPAPEPPRQSSPPAAKVPQPAPASPPTKDARMRARKAASTGASERAQLIEDLYRQVQVKQRLTQYSFRFRSDELEKLDRVFEQLKQQGAPTLSKNDLPRIALNWLLNDFEKNGGDSVLAQVLARA